MKNMKNLIVLVVTIGVLGMVGVAYADEFKTPADIAVVLTGKSTEDVNKQRSEGKTYGTIAKEAGKLDEFKSQMLEQKKAILDQKVKDGTLTKQQADEIYNQIKTNQVTCDGTGNIAIGKKFGAGFGQGKGKGNGAGSITGRGMKMGNGGFGGNGYKLGAN